MFNLNANRMNMRIKLADGSPTETKLEAGNYIAGKISRNISGGAFVTAGHGFWVHGAENDDLTGKLEQTVAVVIDIAVPFELVPDLTDLAPKIVAEGCYLFGITAEWVHVEWTPHTAMHFSIDALEGPVREAV